MLFIALIFQALSFWMVVMPLSLGCLDFNEGIIMENINSKTCLILGALQIWYQRQVEIFFLGYRVWS